MLELLAVTLTGSLARLPLPRLMCQSSRSCFLLHSEAHHRARSDGLMTIWRPFPMVIHYQCVGVMDGCTQ